MEALRHAGGRAPALVQALDSADDATAALYLTARNLTAASCHPAAVSYWQLYRAAVTVRRTLPGGLDAATTLDHAA